MKTIEYYHQEAISLLSKLIETPSFSREEDKTADIIFNYLKQNGFIPIRHKNNIVCYHNNFEINKPIILLNSHHDTVRPNAGYIKDPFKAIIEEGKIFGLGSNDAGGCLVSLIMGFIALSNYKNLKYNIVLAATAEEEISGENGIESVLENKIIGRDLNENDFAIVGEPTMMQMAIAERGLMVVDGMTLGKAGHTANNTGENALYKAIEDLNKIIQYDYSRNSDLLGKNQVHCTIINTPNKAHNVVPDTCNFTIDCRINENYSFEEFLSILKSLCHEDTILQPRSTRLKSSLIPICHPLVQSGLNMNKTYYGSPTTSDKALIPIPTLKIGPGDSARSHTPDEYIYIDEIKQGISDYINLIINV